MSNVAHRIYYFAGTHWDREWYQTFQGFRIQLVRMIDDLIGYFENHSDIAVFHLDGQTILLEDYLEVRPENRARLAALIRDGKIVIGPWYCMPDEFLLSGESLIRNLQLGHRLCAEWGAGTWKVGYICDIFGHIAQFPQILAGFGIGYAVLGRGTNEHTTPAFFRWQSPDGSEALTFKIPDRSGYGSFAMEVCGQRHKGVTVDAASLRFEADARAYIDHEKGRSAVPVAIITDAMDHEPLHHEIPQYIGKMAQMYPQDTFLQGNLIEAFEEAAKSRSLMPIRKGELNETGKAKGPFLHLLTHTLSSRQSIKERNDRCEQLLEKFLEPLVAYLPFRGIVTEPNYLHIAWRHLLQNHPHDSICGCSVDRVHEEMKYRFSQVESICEAVREDSFSQLSDGVRIIGSENRYVTIFNPLPLPREGSIAIEVPFERDYIKWEEPFGYQEICAFRIYDPEGHEVRYIIEQVDTGMQIRTAGEQTVQTDLYHLRIDASLAAFGTTSLRIEQQAGPARCFRKIAGTDGSLENGKVAVRVEPDGTLTITNKRTGKTYRNLLGLADDGEIGDGWNSVRPVRDTEVSKTVMTGLGITVNNSIYGEIVIDRELRIPRKMVYSEKGIYRSDETENLKCRFTVGLAADSDEIGIRLSVDNTCTDHRLRLVIPAGIGSGTYRASQAFTFVERPCGIDESTGEWKEKAMLEKAMSGIVYMQDSTDTLAFISASGLHECGVSDDPRKTMFITLLRAFSKTLTTNGEPGGQELFEHSYEFRLVTGDGSLTPTALQRIQDAMQAPLYSYAGSRPDNRSLISVEGDVCVSALKPSLDMTGLVLRLYNVENVKKNYRIRCRFDVGSACLCDLLEESTQDLGSDAILEGDIAPGRILSFKITPKGPSAVRENA